MGYRAVLFDLDGTILDTVADLADSMNIVLASLGFAPHGIEEYKLFVGDGAAELARRALPENARDDAAVQRTAAAMREEYGRRYDRKTRPYGGITQLLEALPGRGATMAVLSNKPDEFTRICVSRFFPDTPFATVRGLRPGSAKKPDPSEALALAREIGAQPEEFLYLGDTGTDMKTAQAAGMFPVGALWGFRSAEELNANGAKALISKPEELLRFF
ncbi:MAG: HAD family hydrolase [Elusimicrobia bacterium]|nr:HAD family hydrolase [Elusimicrobiota bacterium]